MVPCEPHQCIIVYSIENFCRARTLVVHDSLKLLIAFPNKFTFAFLQICAESGQSVDQEDLLNKLLDLVDK